MIEKKEFKILSIDGGGIRGVFPAYLLSKIEEELGQPLWQYFDLICGTSTGGIIALAIASGKKISEVLDLYEKNASSIFPQNNKTFGLIRAVFGNGGYYHPDKFEGILRSFFEVQGKSLKILDAHTRICIPAVDLCTGKPRVYKTPHAVIKSELLTFHADMELNIWEVARATSAAPFLFPTAKIKDSHILDGGLWANNPSLVGLVEALRVGFSLDEIKILSIGTGFKENQTWQSDAKRMNAYRWVKKHKFLDLLMDVQSQAVCNQLDHILKPDCYLRINASFEQKIGMADVERIPDLRIHGEAVFQSQKTAIIGKFFKNFAKHLYKSGGSK